MLDRITPLLLTWNELPNVPRTLSALAWARRIVVVDSGSTDGTREWLAADPRVRVLERTFDSHAAQWEHGLRSPAIETEWVLALDADHRLGPAGAEELRALAPGAEVGGYEARFVYCIEGRPLRGSLYPPRIVLARRERARFVQDGHTQRLEVDGPVRRLREAIFHDDRKGRLRWLASQPGYAASEAEKLLALPSRELSRSDRLRRLGFVAPWLVPLWCLIVKRGVLDGSAGWVYAGERAVAEWLLAMAIFERRIRG